MDEKRQPVALAWLGGRERLTSAAIASCKIGVMIALTAVGANVRVHLPHTPVPVTLQTFFVLLSGAWLGASRGALAQTSYAALGCLGVPLFAGFACGAPYLLGPTGGYIIGFAPSAWLVGRIMRLPAARQSLAVTLLAMFAGLCVIYAFGVVHLALVTGAGLAAALQGGMLPFIPGAIVKATGAAVIAYHVMNRREAAS